MSEPILRPVVVAGPSGVGKSTNITRLMKEFPGRFGFSVSHTTRLPRACFASVCCFIADPFVFTGPGEEDGVQYHFVTQETFKEEIERDEFIEWAVYAGNYYGTTVKALKDVKQKGQIALLDIDLQGVKSLKARPDLDPYYLVLVPPSVDDLQKRLEGRGDTR